MRMLLLAAALLAVPAAHAVLDPHLALDRALDGLRDEAETHRYPIRGATLADLPGKFGGPPGDDGEPTAGSARPSLGYLADVANRTAVERSPRCDGTLWTATSTLSVEWDLTWTILLPAWSDYGNASAGQKAEWDRFVEAVRVHEEGHVAVGTRAFEDPTPATTFTGSQSGCTEQEALDAAYAEAVGHLAAEEARLAQAISDAGDAYDEETGHGATQGATLNTAVP